MGEYVHGYEGSESDRLCDQARTLEALLHQEVAYPPGSTVLEAGCGVGSQTVSLARNNPGARITAVDISAASVARARARIGMVGITGVDVQQADVTSLPFEADSFDHVFVCFVLEHLGRVGAGLSELYRVLKPGGTITVIEGDHGSTVFHPNSKAARVVVDCLIELQRRAGGDALIGRRLHPLLQHSGFEDVRVTPCVVYADESHPQLQEGFVRETFTAMIEGVRESAVGAGLITPERFEAGIGALHRAAEPDGTFCYVFFKAKGRKRPA